VKRPPKPGRPPKAQPEQLAAWIVADVRAMQKALATLPDDEDGPMALMVLVGPDVWATLRKAPFADDPTTFVVDERGQLWIDDYCPVYSVPSMAPEAWEVVLMVEMGNLRDGPGSVRR
jgi:hypothetical protein